MCIGKSFPDKCILPKGSYFKSMCNLLLSKGDGKNIVCSNVCKTLTGPGQANLQKVESSTITINKQDQQSTSTMFKCLTLILARPICKDQLNDQASKHTASRLLTFFSSRAPRRSLQGGLGGLTAAS